MPKKKTEKRRVHHVFDVKFDSARHVDQVEVTVSGYAEDRSKRVEVTLELDLWQFACVARHMWKFYQGRAETLAQLDAMMLKALSKPPDQQ